MPRVFSAVVDRPHSMHFRPAADRVSLCFGDGFRALSSSVGRGEMLSMKGSIGGISIAL